jgi:hypothetical protein
LVCSTIAAFALAGTSNCCALAAPASWDADANPSADRNAALIDPMRTILGQGCHDIAAA